ncbi:MAG: helicase-exonuclease AddAB subunit AddA [Lachnospiraceae bacterium]|nr:helicase-exonuclease AddAB subunit AddA [Lachnospiraceae bacterium]
MEFTKDQQNIIDARDCSLIVSAAAGSGKTAVLVERIIRLVTDPEAPVDIDSLLVVTFTNVAASQMREKIRNELAKRAEAYPDDDNIKRQATLLHNARITTIDSFCQFVLRNSFADIDIDPGFRIAEEGENKLIEADVLDEIIEKNYESGDEDFLYLSDHIATGASDSSLAEAIYSVYTKAISDPWPYRWLDKHSRDYECDSDAKLSGWIVDMVRKRAISKLEITFDIYKKAIETAETGGVHQDYIDFLESEYELIQGVADRLKEDDEADYDTVRDLVFSIPFDRLPSKKDSGENKSLRDKAKSYRDRAKDTVNSLKTRYLSGSEEDAVRHIQNSGRAIKALCKVTAEYMDALRAAKADKGILSFSDCEHYALDILVHVNDDGSIELTDTAASYRSHFKYVFIDEYQDSNMIQELLLSAVSGESEGIYNRFMVGDVKQSIYRFRQAEPEIFISKYREYKYDDPRERKIDLNKNFRSRKQVIDSCNSLFEKIMNESSAGCDYDEHSALKTGADYPDPDNDDYITELIFTDVNDCEDDAKSEGEVIAERIIEMMESRMQIRDPETKEMRPVRYGDIVILYRAGINDAVTYKKALEKRLIPAVLTGSTGYFETYEIRTLMNFLRIVVNPLQDIPFYGVLNSVIGGFDTEDIALISTLYRDSLEAGVRPGKGYLYAACKYVADKDTDSEEAKAGKDNKDSNDSKERDLTDRIRDFLEMIEKYRGYSEFLTVPELLVKLLDETDYKALVTSMRGGVRRAANVDMLVRKASDYSGTSYFGLYNFIRYIDNLEQTATQDAEAETNGEMTQTVRIMTEHKSKGLEFPVVFIARIGNMFNMTDTKGNVICDHGVGIGIKDNDIENRVKYDNLMYRYISDHIHDQTLAEEMRILYVSMTRAMEKLIIVCAVKPEHILDDDNVLTSKVIKRPKSNLRYIDWYLQCICDEEGEDSIVFDDEHGERVIASMHIKISMTEEHEESELEKAVDASLAETMVHSVLEAGAAVKDSEYRKLIDAIYEYEYPHDDLKGLYTKTSVSVLKHAAMPDDADRPYEMISGEASDIDDTDKAAGEGAAHKSAFDIPVPRFISGTVDVPGATVRGSAFHRILELCDFAGLHNSVNKEEDIDKQIASFLADKRISLLEKRIFDKRTDHEMLMNFINSETAGRMAKAQQTGRLFREAPFMMGIPASALGEQYPEYETVLIQGIIDVYWIEEDGAVILDYKTDRVHTKERFIELYKTQLDYYEEALVKMHIPVKEKLIYSFEMDKIIRV